MLNTGEAVISRWLFYLENSGQVIGVLRKSAHLQVFKIGVFTY